MRILTEMLMASLIWVGLILLAGSASAHVESDCGITRDYIEKLDSKWGETMKGFGVVPNGSLIALFFNEETGSWTVVNIKPNGMTCQMSSGQNWEQVDEAEPNL